MGWNHELLVIASKQPLDGAGNETENNASCIKAASSLVSSQKFMARRLAGKSFQLAECEPLCFHGCSQGRDSLPCFLPLTAPQLNVGLVFFPCVF